MTKMFKIHVFSLFVLVFFPILLQGQWTQIGETFDGSHVGSSPVSVSADGHIAAVGAVGNDSIKGMVKVYERVASNWVQLGQTIVADTLGDRLGCAISLSANGTILAVGAKYSGDNNDRAGKVSVYSLDDGVWTLLGNEIKGENYNYLGNAVDLSADGSVLVVGAVNHSFGYGLVRVYQFDGAWIQVGQDIEGEEYGEHTGNAVAISADGSIIAVGADKKSDAGLWSGQVRLYQNVDGSWVQMGQDLNGDMSSDYFGGVVSLNHSGNRVAIGAKYNDTNGHSRGIVRVFQYDGSAWVQVGADIIGDSNGDESGWSASLSADGSVVAIGAIGNDDGATNAGQVKVFQLDNGSWFQVGQSMVGEKQGELFGATVDLSADGSVLIAGSYRSGYTIDRGFAKAYENPILVNMNEVRSKDDIVVFPNPTTDKIWLNFSELQANSVTLYDRLGRKILSKDIVKDKDLMQIKMSDMKPGMYWLSVQAEENFYIKVVKE